MLGQRESQQPSAVEDIFTYFATVMSEFFTVLIHSPNTSLSPFTFWAGSELQVFMFGESTIADSHHLLKGLPNSLASYESPKELETEPGNSSQVQIARGLQSLLWIPSWHHFASAKFLLCQDSDRSQWPGVQVDRKYGRCFSFGLKLEKILFGN